MMTPQLRFPKFDDKYQAEDNIKLSTYLAGML